MSNLSAICRLAAMSALIATASLPVAAAAQSSRCLNPDEAQAMAVAALPDALSSARKMCAGQLPAGSALQNASARITQIYKPAADRAWPEASRAFLASADISMPPSADPAFVRPFLRSVVTSLVEQQIKPTDCGAIDDFYAALEPLPPANVGKLLVALIKLDDTAKKPANAPSSPFKICKDAAR
ncbi:hypothetical protein [Blastomonas sp.]|uniref:hypothetical protein n=1 Tax=Blastomonas sp. TaxID=1909299 RepID=UPI0035942639